ncbi:OmpH family outer membrane protein [Kingella kingae]|uniref:OmpH family outer membrane protein n=1 Tax=Kingella kingae TaxID=504 RepID=UPI00040AD490|nr:OmpH family outer membrane protein [Kingella kingae]
MKTTIFSALKTTTVAGCFLLATPAWAEMKFGYVNPERVYTETQAAKRIEATLQREFGQQQKELSNMREAGLKLQQEVASGKLSATAQKEAEAKLLEAGQKYRVAAMRLTEEYSLRRNEEFAALQNNANSIIHNIAESEKFDLIVQEAVFVNGKYDITDRVIQLLDQMK